MPLSTILQHTSYKALYYNVLWGCCDRTVVGFTTTYDMYAENMLKHGNGMSYAHYWIRVMLIVGYELCSLLDMSYAHYWV